VILVYIVLFAIF